MKHCMTAIVTPMQLNGDVDYSSFSSLLEWQICCGTDAIVILGTTGEAPTLTHDERIQLIKTAIAQNQKRIPIIVGTGTYDTRSSIEYSLDAQSLGADAVLVINPYYNRPTQNGLFLHFKAIHDAIDIPLILYNHPGRTGGSLDEETIIKLSQLDRIIGIKDTSYDTGRVARLRAHCTQDFWIWSACDDNTVEFIEAGGDGVISVTANIVPDMMKTMVDLAIQKNVAQATALQKKLMPLHQATCLETNPIPVKYALYLMKKIPLGSRLPLTVLEDIHQETMKRVLFDFDLLLQDNNP